MSDLYRIRALQQIEAFEGPQWLVKPIPRDDDMDIADELNEIATVCDPEYRTLSTTVMGWSDYDAIIAFDCDDGSEAHYLARLES